jgi:signal transduction histidine kinase
VEGYRSRFRLWLLLPFGAVVASFFASTFYSQRHERTIDDAALSIANNASPSIESLSEARAELRRLQLALTLYVTAPPAMRGLPLADFQDAQHRVESKVRLYLSLPYYPGERELWAAMNGDLARVEQASTRAFAQVNAGDRAGALATVRDQLRQAVDQTIDDLSRAVQFNARQAQELAMRIERERVRSNLIAYGLDAVSALFAVAAALFAMRAVRRYTALLEAHNRLVEDRAAELEQFAGRVAHDVLSPLSAVSIALALLEPRVADDAKATSFIARGRSSLAHVRRIVDGLLEFARAGARPVEDSRAQVSEVIDEVIAELQPFARDCAVDLAVDPAATKGTVCCSAGVLTSLVANLVRNAIKHMGEGAVRRVRVRAAVRDGRVRVEVEDSGPGIPTGMESRIFEPWVRGAGVRQEGVGLGLATVKRLVQAHGGQVGVKAAVGGPGSCFWFELPCAPSLPAEEARTVH